MNYAQKISLAEQQLEAIGADKENISYVFKELKKWSTLDYLLHQNKEVTKEDLTLIETIMAQLLTERSPQYIVGKAYFRQLELMVDQRVLIPRPETEELVDLILAENEADCKTLLDIGTGSGAIAISLKDERPQWLVTASDISLDALSLAKANAQMCQQEITFCQSDVFSSISGKFDIIVSNPPYIAFDDKDEVGRNVLLSEPHIALFAEEDGFAIYRHILKEAKDFLTTKGKLYFEIGYKQGPGLLKLAETYFPEKRKRLVKDCFGKDRMVVIDNG
ncbi:peptide chain release factor N(5)-glutamine methyltransferase [Streptococcus iniae]|uniref:Release factor glutamine methyltransferase n=1 Tax=Streptococcus iniae TaxID=1346 RepID=A0A3L8GIQ2_STRIN|nr:peptide chain release factor N(5)-glutamine methyltransferase [Streptococcus iniae]AGM98848.1 methyltransferase [Streptococcus iniae SF1]AHY15807.1 SAM-dependent methyltransferase [Streptococcus iniae]AHY17675.1 SAM-dependent methyltransferase [Streptococcus iniae]AJG25972.1 SAM-dependent methyltransferase [Streptococcus iniae]APD31847.1 protein-(glutamine-N5) methyltransferase, release factor-specific [Streptococcus iniae]